MNVQFGPCLTPQLGDKITIPSALGFERMAEIMGPRPMLRLTPSLPLLFSTATTTNFDATDEAVARARAGRYTIYLQPSDLPPFATGGVPAYVSGVGGSSCQELARRGVPREMWAQVFEVANSARNHGERLHLVEEFLLRATDIPPLPPTQYNAKWVAKCFVEGAEGDGGYEGEQQRTWRWNDREHGGGGQHVYGDKGFEEADKLSAPSPWIAQGAPPVPVDSAAMEYIGETLGARYGDDCDLFGMPVNEPDIDLYFPPIRDDGVNEGPAGDTYKDILLPLMRAYIVGLRSALGRASELSATPRMPLVCGPEVAYAGTLDRLLMLERAGRMWDVLTHHGYGSGAMPGSSYAALPDYDRIISADGRASMLSEIDGDDLATWLRTVRERNLLPRSCGAVMFNDGEKFIAGWNTGGTEVTEQGRRMQAEIAGMNLRRRVARS